MEYAGLHLSIANGSMKFLVSVFILLPIFSPGQNKFPYKNILPKDVKARPFLDSSNNYLPDSLKQIVLDYIESENIDPEKCFINENIFFDERERKFLLRLEDVEDLKNERNSETAIKNKQKPLSYSKGFSRTLVIDTRTKRVILVMYDN